METDNMKDREDNLIKTINDFIESENNKGNKQTIDKNDNKNPKQYIMCRYIEVTHKYFYINTDMSNNELNLLLDGCKSEDDMRNTLHKNGISIVEDEEVRSECESEFCVCSVEDFDYFMSECEDFK